MHWLLLLLTCAPQTTDAHRAMNERGAMVMGFDQQKTAHHFLLYDDGGAIDIQVKDPSDASDLDAIRAHLPHIAEMFAEGKFDAPMLVHDSQHVPGSDVLAHRKTAIRYVYRDTPQGGRVDIVTNDRTTLDAVHRFLRYQIEEHRTGDSTSVAKRP
jgi:hypothetical protein